MQVIKKCVMVLMYTSIAVCQPSAVLVGELQHIEASIPKGGPTSTPLLMAKLQQKKAKCSSRPGPREQA